MDLDAFRAQLPVLRERAYLFAGGICPLAEPVRAAQDAVLDRWRDDPAGLYATLGTEWEDARAAFARITGADPAEIALVDSTSRGSNLAAQMLDVAPGDNVVVDDYTYWSSRVPWLLRARRGVEVRRVAARPDATIALDDIAAAVDGRTRAVSITAVAWQSGFRHDLAAVAEIAHAAGALLIVDTAQHAGAARLELAAAGVDLASGLAMKWLLGTPGVGFLYVRRELIERLEPAHVGYASLANLFDDDVFDAPRFHPTAARYELGIPNVAALAACTAGIGLLEAVGIDTVEAQVQALATRLVEGLAARGLTTLTPHDPARRAGVVALRCKDGPEIVAEARAAGVDIWTSATGDLLRLDPHAYNTADDVDRALAVLDGRAARLGRGALQ